MLLVLLFITILFILTSYYAFDKEFYSPCILFYTPFALMFVVAIAYQNAWKIDLSAEAFLIFCIGFFAFLIGALFLKKVKIKRNFEGYEYLDYVRSFNVKMIVFIALYIISFAWKAKTLMAYGNANGLVSLGAAINIHNNADKLGGIALIDYPRLLNILNMICLALNYYLSFLLAQVIISKKQKIILPLIAFIIGICYLLLDGSRGPILEVLISFAIILFILYFKNKKRKSLPLRKLLIFIFALVVLVYAFFGINSLIGRSEMNIGDYLGIYLGAQVYNFDYFLNHVFDGKYTYGATTFNVLLKGIQRYVDIDFDYTVPYPFVRSNGYSLGNVYTTFYEFFSDFGFVGPLLLCFIMGIISEYLFKKTKGEGKNQYLHLILYGYVAPLLIFSFFSNRFFSYFVTIQMVIKVFWIWMINYFMKAKTPFKKIRWRR